MPILTIPLPPLELLQELFEISVDSPSGLKQKTARSGTKPGKIAGSLKSNGYWYVTVTTDKPRIYLNHRIIYFLQTQKDPKTEKIDHITGVHNNLNLRLATTSQNAANKKKANSYKGKKCSSKFKGVSWVKKTNKWQAQIKFHGKAIYLGVFTNELEAAKAYNNAAIKYFGEFAKINKLEQ
jgi:hypothetical protein